MGCALSIDEYDSRSRKATGYKYTSAGKRYITRAERGRQSRGCSSVYKPGYKWDSISKVFKGPNYRPRW